MRLVVLQTGQPQPELLSTRGPYARWIAEGMGLSLADVIVVDAVAGERLPEPDEMDGLMVTGSPLSVRDKAPWSVTATDWLKRMVEAEVPTLAICYGHQMLGEAYGGAVELNPKGREIGVVEMETLTDDPLFDGLPDVFPAIITHSDAVMVAPPDVPIIARTEMTEVQAMAFGPVARSIQWHPEMDAAIIRQIIAARAAAIDAEKGAGAAQRIYDAVVDVHTGPTILRNFARHYLGL